MVDIENYISRLTELLRQRFGERLLYVGLQGSYLRGEATEHSDIDIMTVIDELDVADLEAYRAVIRSLEHAELSCGFICGKEELANWNPLEICHLLHSTKDHFGSLRPLLPEYTEQDVRNYIQLGLGNLYHELCHRRVHGKAENTAAAMPAAYKSTFFILQNICYLRHGIFAATKAELLPMTEGADRAVLERSMAPEAFLRDDAQNSFDLLFTWCRDTLRSL